MSPVKPVDPKDPEDYIAQIGDPVRRSEIEALDKLIREEAPGLPPHIYAGMLGYGRYHYRYASGREGDAAVVALASQKRHISIYVSAADREGYLAERWAERLPGASIGKSCIRFTRLERIDVDELRHLIREASRFFAAKPDFAIAG